MTGRVLTAIIAVACLVGIASAAGIKEGSLTASSNGTNIVVRWVSDDEFDVRGYNIERRAGANGPFILLTNPSISCKGNGAAYEYTDNTVFRVNDNIYQYRITMVGSGKDYYVTVTHAGVSSVRRTWGSIKAMFR